MTQPAMSYGEAAGQSLADMLAQVLRDRRPISIAGPGGARFEIRLVTEGAKLGPLETLPGCVPPDWKDAVYGPRR